MPYPSSTTYPSSTLYPGLPETPGEPGIVQVVREKPPLRLNVDIETPAGRHYRWAADEPDPINVPSGMQWSDTMPGGFENFDCTLPRKPGRDYADLERLSTITIRDPGGGIVGEYRLERAPRVSGDQMAISPSAVGWQAHLTDNRGFRQVYVDRNVGEWQTSGVRDKQIADSGFPQGKIQVTTGDTILWAVPAEALVAEERTEVVYDIGAGEIGRVEYKGSRTGAWTNLEAATLYTSDTETFASSSSTALTLDDTRRSTTPSAARYAMLRAKVSTGHTPADGVTQFYSELAVYGDHGLTVVPIDGDLSGLSASDVIAHALSSAAPLLNQVIESSAFPIPHLVFREPVTAADVLTEATKYSLNDWAVWDNRTFYWHTRGARGKNWRARVGPAQLQETGPQVDRLWNSVMVSYQSGSFGTIRTVGPVGSGADTETDDLRDMDPENPANKLGIDRMEVLSIGINSAAGATEIGRRFLEETKALDSSGQATIVGYVEDDHGVTFPYHAIRAGDTITFVDAADPSPRRIVKTSKDAESRSCSVDLDAPPDGLQAVLARLGAT